MPPFLSRVLVLVRAAFRVNLGPALVLQTIALALVLDYAFHGLLRPWMDAVAREKLRWGISFSMVSTTLAAGIAPLVLQHLRSGSRRESWRHLPFLIVLWALKGAEVDLFYRAQAAIFGVRTGAGGILLKVLVDQILYCPFWAVPTMLAAYAWKDGGYRAAGLRHWFARGWYGREVLPVMTANWIVWLPATAMIYSLPLALQVPMQNLVLCLWVLLFRLMSGPGRLLR